MDKKTIFITLLCVLFVVSLAVNGFLVFVLTKNQASLEQLEVSKKILDFRNMFTQDVLLSNKEIDFDTRLAMETSVRNLNNPEIFSQWQKFTNSQTKKRQPLKLKDCLAC